MGGWGAWLRHGRCCGTTYVFSEKLRVSRRGVGSKGHDTYFIGLRTEDEDGFLASTMSLDGLLVRFDRPCPLPMVEDSGPEPTQSPFILMG